MAATLLRHARIATLDCGDARLVEPGAMLCEAGRIAWLGEEADVAARLSRRGDVEEIDAHGALLTPALVDCHTHLVYAGHRAHEFEMRLAGASYEDIARAGGGILSTVAATRAASDGELLRQSSRRLEELRDGGVGTVEIKSGYGLDLETELRCLRIARTLGQDRGVSVATTLLAAHAVPRDAPMTAEAYVDFACGELIPAAAREGLADAVDAFCERIAFTPAQVRRVFEAARAHGLRVKLHADQLSDGGGASLAAEFGALSADHLEHASEAGIAAMARAGTVAVLLPGAFHFLRETRRPPVEALRRHGVRMAVATDSNPGTSPCTSLTTMMNMACVLFGLTPLEALAGATRHAAAALGLADRGVLQPGRRADWALWDAETPAELAWTIAGRRPLQMKTAPQGGAVGVTRAAPG